MNISFSMWCHRINPESCAHAVLRYLCIALLIAGSNAAQAQTSTPLLADSSIDRLAEEGYTLVAFSTQDRLEALEMHRTYREHGMTGQILTGLIEEQVFYRLAFGQFSSREQATSARQMYGKQLPEETWFLNIEPGTRILSKDDWLPIHLSSTDSMSSSVADSETLISSTSSNSNLDPQAESTEANPLMPEFASSTGDENSKVQAPGQTSQRYEEIDEDEDDNEAEDSESEPAPVHSTTKIGRFLDRHFNAMLQFSNIYEDNIEHDAEIDAIQSYGMVPSLQLQFQTGGDDPLFTVEYLVAHHSYSNTERWDRTSHAFRTAFLPIATEKIQVQTEAELSLKGSSEDRDVSNQFQIEQEVEFRFTRRHRLQVYGTYRIKRFPDEPGVQDFKPNVGINFERRNSDGERFETGARYEFNKEDEARGNYKRWTFSVEYRSPEFNNGRDQFEIGMKHRSKSYTARFVELDDEDYLRQDHRLGIQATWIHDFGRGVSTELGYEFETRDSNDPDRLYEANAFRFVMTYEL